MIWHPENKNRKIYKKYIFINKKMLQKLHNEHQSQQRSLKSDLHLSIENINQIMQRINQAVKRSQTYLQEDHANANHQNHHSITNNCETFITQQNLITEFEDNVQSTRNSKNRNGNSMKIPLHQLHKKNKLSTVVEESQSQQSGRTQQQGLTPRDFEKSQNQRQVIEEIPSASSCSFTRQVVVISDCQTTPVHQQALFPIEQHQTRKSKKIMGIRKASCFNGGQFQKKQYELKKDKLQRSEKKLQVHTTELGNKDRRYLKTKSMSNIKCEIFDRKIQYQFSQKITEEFRPIEKQKERSRSRKGLSLLSKRSLNTEENDHKLKEIQSNQSIQNSNMKEKKAFTQLSLEKGQKKNNKITIKRKTINPFILSKQLEGTEQKKDKKTENRLKNCLSRTSVRDFFVSKRINK